MSYDFENPPLRPVIERMSLDKLIVFTTVQLALTQTIEVTADLGRCRYCVAMRSTHERARARELGGQPRRTFWKFGWPDHDFSVMPLAGCYCGHKARLSRAALPWSSERITGMETTYYRQGEMREYFEAPALAHVWGRLVIDGTTVKAEYMKRVALLDDERYNPARRGVAADAAQRAKLPFITLQPARKRRGKPVGPYAAMTDSELAGCFGTPLADELARSDLAAA